MQKIIRISLVIIWMFVIFMFSQPNGEKSSGTSTRLIKQSLINISNVLTKIKVVKKPLSEEKATKIAEKLNYPARKAMHMAEYFILALLLYWAIVLYRINKTYLLTFIISVLYAISDEIHQLFSARTGAIKDVLIDTIGVILAIIVIDIVKKTKTKHA